MRKTMLTTAIVAALAASMLPAAAYDPTTIPDRYLVEKPGTEVKRTWFFGPFVVPAGQDNNKVLLDLPTHTGFFTAVRPNLIDAVTGVELQEQHAHIHHAHWFRVNHDSEQYHSYGTGLSWVFGTGEEKSQGKLSDRDALESIANGGDGRRYGIPIDGSQPQALIFMIHNKTPQTLTAYITLDVEFIYGSMDQLAARGIKMHPLTGVLWGATRDVKRGTRGWINDYGTRWEVPWDGTIVASAGHAHPGAKGVVITNLGPAGKCGYANGVARDANGRLQATGAELDPDGDGYPGVTILNSHKYDRIAEAGVYSEDYQMGASKYGWRVPIRKGDVLAQFGVYDVSQYSWYAGMAFTGIYVDRLSKPAPVANLAALCGNLADTDTDNDGAAIDAAKGALTPTLIGDDVPGVQSFVGTVGRYPYPTGVTQGLVNHQWYERPDPLCGISYTNDSVEPIEEFEVACEGAGPAANPYPQWDAQASGPITDTIRVTGFQYVPGNLGSASPIGDIPRVRLGSTLRFINDDISLGIRHTFTSCAWPCNGIYYANYPVPDGRYSTGKLGNLDYIDGGLVGADTVPFMDMKIESKNFFGGLQFEANKRYAYYCTLHPTMRGAFEVVAADAT